MIKLSELKPGDLFKYRFKSSVNIGDEQDGTYIGFAKRKGKEEVSNQNEGKNILRCSDVYVFKDVEESEEISFNIPVDETHTHYNEFELLEILESIPEWESMRNIKRIFKKNYSEYTI